MPRGRTLWGALIVAAAVMLVTPAMLSAQGPARFGSLLTTDTQPSNAGTGHFCNDPEPAPHPICTWVMQEAYGRPDGGHKAPKAGTIGKVRVISCTPGNFKIQLARSKPVNDTARVIRNGPTVSFSGDPDGCDDEVYTINTINVDFSVLKGEQIAIRTNKTAALRCSSGGSNTLLFDPTLAPGGTFTDATENDGCWLLVEFQYKPGS